MTHNHDAPRKGHHRGGHNHWMHLAMCAPMVLVFLVLLLAGTVTVAGIVPVIGCIAMMFLMMRMMGSGQHGGHG